MKMFSGYEQNNMTLRRYTVRQKLYNCVWIFKIGDPDDKPSVPHAHSKENGYRLNAWTGEVYPAGSERKNIIGQLSRKELTKLHRDKNFLKFAKKQIEWYQKEYPCINFYIPEWFRIRGLSSKEASIRKEGSLNTYIFIGQANIK